MDALYYGQGIGGVIFDSQNARDADGNTLLAVVAGGVSTLALVRVVLKWGVDINAVNCRFVNSIVALRPARTRGVAADDWRLGEGM